MRDAVRLAVGTLTVLRVRPPGHVDRRTAGRAMVLAPLVGLALAAVVVVGLRLLDALPAGPSSLVAATLAVAAVAGLTRGLHLDGLADTADGLGSGRDPAGALEVMRRSDIGPFGVATLVLALLLQVAALATALDRGAGPSALVVALVTSRLVLPVTCSTGVPAARTDGLGSLVAGSVSRLGLVAAVALAATALALAAGVDALTSPGPGVVGADGAVPRLVLGAVAPLLVSGWLCRRCVRRLGGVTGDVLGACVEVAFTASLVLGTFG